MAEFWHPTGCCTTDASFFDGSGRGAPARSGLDAGCWGFAPGLLVGGGCVGSFCPGRRVVGAGFGALHRLAVGFSAEKPTERREEQSLDSAEQVHVARPGLGTRIDMY